MSDSTIVVAVLAGIVTLISTVITLMFKRSTDKGDGVHKLIDQLQKDAETKAAEITKLWARITELDQREEDDRAEKEKLRTELDQTQVELRSARAENTELRTRVARLEQHQGQGGA